MVVRGDGSECAHRKVCTDQEAVCTQCVNGKYKSLIGSAACSNCNSGYVSNDDYSDCIPCEAGKYEENDECLSCAAINVNSYSVAGSTACLCNAGSSGPDDGPCVLCQAGKYKSSAGSSSCTDSPEKSDHVTDCTCVAPFSGPGGGPCACAAGSATITRQNYDSGINGHTCQNILDSISSVTFEQCQLACDIIFWILFLQLHLSNVNWHVI